MIETRGSSATWIRTLLRPTLSLALVVPALAAFADPEPAPPRGARGSSLEGRPSVPAGARALDEAALAEAAMLEAEPATAAETDLPAGELRLDTALGTVAAFDRDGRAFGTDDGRVCVLMLDDFTLKARHSANGGGLFGAEVVVAGGTGQPRVKQYAARRSAADGSVYVALVVADAAGGVGLQFARSDDTCQTWTTPLALVGFGDATDGVRSVAIATGASGAAAIIYRGDLGFDPYVVATTNSGGTWTTPVRVDTGVATRTFPSGGVDVAIDPATGTIHAVYSQDRGSGPSIWRSRSTDLGVTFGAEVSFDSILAAGQADSLFPDVEVATDGSILVAFWDSIGTDRIYVVRSVNGGTSYTNVLNRALGGTNVATAPIIATAAGSSTVLVLWVDQLKQLALARSATSGAAFDATQNLVATAAGSSFGIVENTRIGVTRTAAGNWVVGWSDDRSDTYAGLKTDVFVRSSTTDGVSWGAEQRVDSDTAGAAASPLADLVANGTDALFVLFQDRRANGGRSADFYGNLSSTANPLAFGTDARVDDDSTSITVDVNLDPAVATDGAGRVYVAFSAFGTGPESDIYVSASANGGYSFASPVRASGGTAGALVRVLPRVRAFPDGKVYLTYVIDNVAGQREIRFNRSTDFGASWGVETILGNVASPEPGYYSFFDRPAVQLEALADGAVYVAWSSEANILLARSFDFGASFVPAIDVDQDARGFNRAPRLCAAGDSLLVVWEGADLAFAFTSVWAVASGNRGSTWGTPAQLRPEGLAGGVALPSVACDGAGQAVALWPDFRSVATLQLFANRFDGASWGGNVLVSTPAGLDVSLPVAAFSGASNVIVAYETSDSGIHASRSTDGGATFPSFQRLDSGMTRPQALSTQPRIVADGGANVWTAWLDESAGLPMLVSRRSPDSGAAWDSPLRIDREVPSGGSSSFYFAHDAATPATLPGAAFFTWAAERDSFLADVLFNVHDLDDMDRDGLPTPGDCNDADATLRAVPAEVSGDRVAKVAGQARLSWTSQAATAGSSTVTDIATGLLSSLRSTRGFGAATCLADGIAGTTFDDPSADPPPRDGRWYLLRMTNGCGTGSFGNSSLVVDPRDLLDSGTTCD